MLKTIRYYPGGGLRKIYEPSDKRLHGLVGRRGSNIHIVDAPGKEFDGEYLVDFSALGDSYQFCMLKTFKIRDNAVKAELDWLRKNWILEGLPS